MTEFLTAIGPYLKFHHEGLIKSTIDSNSFMTMQILVLIGCAIVGYLIGSLNFGVVLSKTYGKDVRTEGSGNAGATNMTRVFGKKAGVLTFFGDFFKAIIATYIGMALWGIVGAYIAGIFCVIGHAYPLYFGFKGGKGVACIAAVGLVTTPLVFLVCLIAFGLILLWFKMVSFASVMTMVIYPFVVYTFYNFVTNLIFNLFVEAGISEAEAQSVAMPFSPLSRVLFAFILAAFVVFLHRKNIVRIFNHEEPKISLGKKKEKSNEEQ